MNVTVLRKDVLEALRTNREEHIEMYEEVMEGYRRESKRILMKKLRQLENGEKVNMQFSLAELQSHVKTFDRIIRMQEMSVDTEIDLSETQFSAYVMGDWDWMRSWALSNSNYSAKTALYAASLQ